MQQLSSECPETGILLGAPIPAKAHGGKGLYNAALLIYRGQVLAMQPKSLLPTYDVFDEARYFDPAPQIQVMPFKGELLGVHICEDAWTDPVFWSDRQLYHCNPVAELAAQGATVLINISASPFSVGKESVR